MTKDQLATKLAKRENITKLEAVSFLESTMEIIKDTMVAHEDIFLRGFGTFKSILRQAKVGQDILRGESVIIPEHHSVKFIPSANIKKALKK